MKIYIGQPFFFFFSVGGNYISQLIDKFEKKEKSQSGVYICHSFIYF